jgi:hypothetical protein
MKWSDIPRFPNIHYRVTIPWGYLLDKLDNYQNEYGLNLDPDFQRGHVWTENQQVAYVEYILQEPQSGKEIYFNHPGWMTDWKGEFVLVDGRQRIEAARRFLSGEIRAFGHLVTEFEGPESKDGRVRIPFNIEFYFNVARLKSRAEVLQWYLDFNAGGTPHSAKEIKRVRELLSKERQQ